MALSPVAKEGEAEAVDVFETAPDVSASNEDVEAGTDDDPEAAVVAVPPFLSTALFVGVEDGVAELADMSLEVAETAAD